MIPAYGRASFTTSAALLIAVALAAGSAGCAHTVVIDSEPVGAMVVVDGKPVGESPVVTRQLTGTGGRLRVDVEAQGYETAHVVVPQSEWFLLPAIVAVTPFLAVPFVVIPFVGPFITVIWAAVTSPTLIALFFLQKYPDRVKVTLKPKLPGGVLLPSDTWLIPEDYDPNPPPLPPPPPPDDVVPLTQPPQPEGGNPVP
jgi:hypothetical protein